MSVLQQKHYISSISFVTLRTNLSVCMFLLSLISHFVIVESHWVIPPTILLVELVCRWVLGLSYTI